MESGHGWPVVLHRQWSLMESGQRWTVFNNGHRSRMDINIVVLNHVNSGCLDMCRVVSCRVVL